MAGSKKPRVSSHSLRRDWPTTATATRPARSAIPAAPIAEPRIIIPTSQSDDGGAVSSHEARETDGETSVAPYRGHARARVTFKAARFGRKLLDRAPSRSAD